ncbi:hypothetical protein Celaphus_00016690 [Cervus elaphus hippelaphus]|uniref:Calponin-homology (CH) domain-containing protein n=1 Tax=Cervus elaphus hippelaphus TaxID=46360 RepID=A0A212C4W5_CEREH|nr:hypothetical protein Celaphus_00016690 [Cervus elaphus hippelaphus]
MTHFNKGPSYGLSAEVKNKIASKYDHQAEEDLRNWIEEVTGMSIGANFQLGLKDGIILCELINKLQPGSVKKSFNHMDFGCSMKGFEVKNKKFNHNRNRDNDSLGKHPVDVSEPSSTTPSCTYGQHAPGFRLRDHIANMKFEQGFEGHFNWEVKNTQGRTKQTTTDQLLDAQIIRI